MGAVVTGTAAVAVAVMLVPARGGSSNPAGTNPAASARATAGELAVIGAPDDRQGDGWYGLSAVGAGGRLRHLVRCPQRASSCGWVESLDWSPSGRWLAISVSTLNIGIPSRGVHVVDIKTGVDRQIRSCVPGRECDWFDLDWSPDGSRLAYVAGGIYVINRDGSGRRHLRIGLPGGKHWPSWSPDGTQIAFASRLGPYEPWSVYVVRPDGTHRRLLAAGTAAPAWSPDGTRIAVTSRCVGIKLLRPAGQDVTPGRGSCRTIGVSGTPVWSPDGTQIAVVGHPQGAPAASTS